MKQVATALVAIYLLFAPMTIPLTIQILAGLAEQWFR